MPDEDLESYLAAISPRADSAQPDSSGRFGSAQVFQVRLPGQRIEQLRRLAEALGTSPSALMVEWVVERLDQEAAYQGSHVPRAPIRPQAPVPSHGSGADRHGWSSGSRSGGHHSPSGLAGPPSGYGEFDLNGPTRSLGPIDPAGRFFPVDPLDPLAAPVAGSPHGLATGSRHGSATRSLPALPAYPGPGPVDAVVRAPLAGSIPAPPGSVGPLTSPWSATDLLGRPAERVSPATTEPWSPPAGSSMPLADSLAPFPGDRAGEQSPATGPGERFPANGPAERSTDEPKSTEDESKPTEDAPKPAEDNSKPARVTPIFRAGMELPNPDEHRGPRHRAPEPVTSLLTRRKF
jgi:hypothetical protein